LRVEAITKTSEEIKNEKAAFENDDAAKIRYNKRESELESKILDAEDKLKNNRPNLTKEEIEASEKAIEEYYEELINLEEISKKADEE
jgi:hypothetical protein